MEWQPAESSTLVSFNPTFLLTLVASVIVTELSPLSFLALINVAVAASVVAPELSLLSCP